MGLKSVVFPHPLHTQIPSFGFAIARSPQSRQDQHRNASEHSINRSFVNSVIPCAATQSRSISVSTSLDCAFAHSVIAICSSYNQDIFNGFLLYLLQTPSQAGLDYILSICILKYKHPLPFSLCTFSITTIVALGAWLRIFSRSIIFPIPTDFPSGHLAVSLQNLGDRSKVPFDFTCFIIAFARF